jgi:hypothetical protein
VLSCSREPDFNGTSPNPIKTARSVLDFGAQHGTPELWATRCHDQAWQTRGDVTHDMGAGAEAGHPDGSRPICREGVTQKQLCMPHKCLNLIVYVINHGNGRLSTWYQHYCNS